MDHYLSFDGDGRCLYTFSWRPLSNLKKNILYSHNSISFFYSDWKENKTKGRQCDNILKYRILAGPARIDGM